MKIILGITGASGAVYGITILKELKKAEVETHLILPSLNPGACLSQYGALSRGVRYVTLPLARKFRRSFREIVSGSFTREWETKRAKLKLRILKKFASRQKIGKIEERVRKTLRINEEES